MKARTSTSTAPEGLRTLSRATLLLRLLAEHRTPQPLSQLAPRSGLHKATVHRVLGALVHEGLVDRTPEGYVLGHQLWLFGEVAAARFDLRDLATPVLRRIAEATSDVALLSVLAGTMARCVAREEGAHPILPMTLRVGAVRPLGCGAHAMALLAALPDAEVARIIACAADREAYPNLTESYLREKVEQTRAQGFALSDQDIVPGMTALGVVVRDPWGRPFASLSCAAISSRLEPARRPEIVAMLRDGAAEIETLLAGR